MSSLTETAAVVALMRSCKPRRGRPTDAAGWARVIEETGSATAILEQTLGLLAGQELAAAEAQVKQWHAQGIRLVTVLDRGYPANLRATQNRPPLVFVAGRLEVWDAQAIAVVGTRRPSLQGLAAARQLAEELVDAGYTVVSGLAEGIDTAAHTTALGRGGRTLAVIGTGLARCYPRSNAGLQREISERCAVISQFWPDTTPSRQNFPLRNAVISGMSLASVIVEASDRSGSRMLGRIAHEQGRRVFLHESLRGQQWGRDLARGDLAHGDLTHGHIAPTPRAHFVRSADEILAALRTEPAAAA